MKKILATAAALTAISFSANAVLLDNHFKKYGYTKPSFTLMDTQNLINKGVSVFNEGLFDKKLKPGTAVPQILNANRLLNALHSKKKILVASNGKACLPIFEELARQNGIKCDELIGHLDINSKDDVDLFSNISNTLKEVEVKVSEMISDDINEEISNEVSMEISEDLSKDLEEELSDIQEQLDQIDVSELTAEIDAFITDIIEIIEANDRPLAEIVADVDAAYSDLAEAVGSEAASEKFAEVFAAIDDL